MEKNSRFEQQLHRLVYRRIFLLIGVGAILFILGWFVVSNYENETNAKKNLADLRKIFLDINSYETGFLFDKDNRNICRNILKGKNEVAALRSKFKQFSANSEIENQIIFLDVKEQVLYSSYEETELSNNLYNYCKAVCFHVPPDESKIYYSSYRNTQKYNDYLYVSPIMDMGEIQGYVVLMLSGTSWNYYLSDRHFDGVITDRNQNAIYTSRAGFVGKVGKFYGSENRRYVLNGDNYLIRSEYLKDEEVTVYSLIYDPPNIDILICLFILIVMCCVWFEMARSMTKSMAEYNAVMIHELVEEIRIIQTENQNHRIKMHHDNEFDEVADRINDMLDSLEKLNQRNIELLNINNTIELNQLTAQMNPHFLYNTLEIIRNLIFWNVKSASDTIKKLTDVLRYSINRTMQDVRLEEDIKYIMEYLEIQKMRFGDRFVCDIDIADSCLDCMVPKLVLQPIIENSIKYGFEKRMDVCVEVKGWMEENMLKLQIRDNGPGMSEEDLEKKNRDIKLRYDSSKSNGLHNISRRLCLQYGNGSGLELCAGEKEGLVVIINIAQISIAQKNGGLNVSGSSY